MPLYSLLDGAFVASAGTSARHPSCRLPLIHDVECDTAGTRTTVFAMDYTTRSTFDDATARWKINDRVAIGGELRWFDTHGSVGRRETTTVRFSSCASAATTRRCSLIVTSNT